MKYYNIGADSTPRLGIRSSEGIYDVTAVASRVTRFRDLARLASTLGDDLDTVATGLIDRCSTTISASELEERVRCPLEPDEVWASGVTYRISEKARETESKLPAIYRDVYSADRPEVFFKATAERTVGPGESIGIRGDSTWNVPEPELAVVLHDGRVIGYTIGNDMSSRSIEGENPLYLPQAKIYARCCAIGPCVTSIGTISDPYDLEISMRIHRDDRLEYEDSTNTNLLVREIPELIESISAHNHLPEVTILLTGTSLVPPEDFTLQQGDLVSISIDSIGQLTNTVVTV